MKPDHPRQKPSGYTGQTSPGTRTGSVKATGSVGGLREILSVKVYGLVEVAGPGRDRGKGGRPTLTLFPDAI